MLSIEDAGTADERAAVVEVLNYGVASNSARMAAYDHETDGKLTYTGFEADSLGKTAKMEATYNDTNEASITVQTGENATDAKVAIKGETTVTGNEIVKGTFGAGTNGTEFAVNGDGAITNSTGLAIQDASKTKTTFETTFYI